MGKLDIVYHLIDHGLSNQVVSTAVKKNNQPVKPTIKSASISRPYLVVEYGQTDMVYHLIDHGHSNQVN